MSTSPSDSGKLVTLGRGRGRERGHSVSPERLGTIRPNSTSPDETSPYGRSESISPPSPVLGVSKLRLADSPSKPREDGSTRGSRRGARLEDLDYFIRTKPKGLVTKHGSKGTPISMVTNYYKMLKVPSWNLYQYHVYFDPLIDEKRVKFKILKANQNVLGAYMYNGTNLYTSTKLEGEAKEFAAQTKTGQVIQVTIKDTGKVEAGDPCYGYFYNGILRRVLFGMELEELGRNFYDRHAAIAIPQQRLTLWPGKFFLFLSLVW
jgi:aubergine-like protein